MPREDKEQEEEQKARTAYDLIRMRLERLQKNIEKPVSIPQRRDSRKPRPPPDFVRNVVGSSAAAGSAEFHIFRNNRKREMDRLDYMNRKALQEELDAKFLAERSKRIEEEEKKTAKKRMKRRRYKEKMKRSKKAKKTNETDGEESDENASGSGSGEDSNNEGPKKGSNEEPEVLRKTDDDIKTKAEPLREEDKEAQIQEIGDDNDNDANVQRKNTLENTAKREKENSQ